MSIDYVIYFILVKFVMCIDHALKMENVQYRVFSRDVTAAMLVSLNKGTVALWVSPINPPGIELYSCANVFFCFS